jgi:hypothetical protein
MGRKTALAPKYVSRLIFALFSPNPPRLSCASCLGGCAKPGNNPTPNLPYEARTVYSIPGFPSLVSRVPSGRGQGD